MNMPALFTSESMRPNRLRPCSTIALAASRFEMSPATARTSGSLEGLIDREFATTREFRSRNDFTSPAPMPCDAPVTMATFCSAPMIPLYPKVQVEVGPCQFLDQWPLSTAGQACPG